jgi:hypothetical protein
MTMPARRLQRLTQTTPPLDRPPGRRLCMEPAFRAGVERELLGCTTTSRNPRWTGIAAEVMIHIKLCMARGLRAASLIPSVEPTTPPASGDPRRSFERFPISSAVAPMGSCPCCYGLYCRTYQAMQQPEFTRTCLDSSESAARTKLPRISKDALDALEHRLREHRLSAAEEAFLTARLATYRKLARLGLCDNCCSASAA